VRIGRLHRFLAVVSTEDEPSAAYGRCVYRALPATVGGPLPAVRDAGIDTPPAEGTV
jgi:hypothetical protein